MQREIYEVYAKVVDANGNYSTLANYPKVFDSRNYSNDPDKAYKRAMGEYHTVLGTMCTRDDRKVQLAMIIRASDGVQVELTRLGELNEPEPEPEPEVPGDPESEGE